MSSKRLRRPTLLLTALVFGAIGAAACGDDDDDDDDDGTPTPTGGKASTGGNTATGGRGGAATGGSAGENAAGAAAVAGNGGAAGAGGEAFGPEPGGAGGGGASDDGGESGGSGAPGTSGAGAGGESDERDVFRPELREFSDELLENLSLPPGFALNVFATGIANARMLAVHGDAVYVTRPMQGDVLRLTDEDGDGTADDSEPVAVDLPIVHGIAFRGDDVFLATDKRIYRGRVTESGAFEGLTQLVGDLPDGGQHPNRTLGIGGDDLLYVSIGSSCNACAETNPEHATLLRVALDGSTRTTFASGLRNTIGFGWHPDTAELWGMDHGSDWLGNDAPPEELNRLEEGNDYGWPYCYGKQGIDPVIQDPPGTSKAAYCAATAPSTLEYQAHGAPIAMAFYAGDAFPEEYRDDAFIAMHGSWNRFPPTGYGVVRVTFEDGEPTGFEDFVTGFLIEEGTAQFGRPAGVAVTADGALLFSDDDNGVIYRVIYEE